jgi:hypothetical protein
MKNSKKYSKSRLYKCLVKQAERVLLLLFITFIAACTHGGKNKQTAEQLKEVTEFDNPVVALYSFKDF